MKSAIDALTESFDASLHVLIKNLGSRLIRRANLGLTPGQVFMLQFIQQASRCTVSELADDMDVAPSAITVMLDRLENRGFVSRVRSEADRRIVNVGMTSAGEEKLNQVIHVRRQIMQHCLTQMEPSDMEPFIQLLGSLASIAQHIDIQEVIE